MSNISGERAGSPKLFEVNLLGDRVDKLRRRRLWRNMASVAALLMLLIGGLLALTAVMHLTTAMRLKLGVRNLEGELAQQQRVCQELDALKKATWDEVQAVSPLIPLARARVAWAPKLAALADELEPMTGLLSVQGFSGDVFSARPSGVETAKGRRTIPPGQEDTFVPRLFIAVLYTPVAGGDENPHSLLERLRSSEPFMRKMAFVRLVATEEDSWNSRPVIVLHCSARGGSSER